MAKTQPRLSSDEQFTADQAANTLLDAKKVKLDKNLHANAIRVIKTRQEIATKVINDN